MDIPFDFGDPVHGLVGRERPGTTGGVAQVTAVVVVFVVVVWGYCPYVFSIDGRREC